MQTAPQRGQDVFDGLLPLLGSTRQWTWWSSQWIYNVIKISDLFVGGLIPHKFNGEYIPPLGLASADPAGGLIRWTSPPPSSLAQQHVEAFCGGWGTSGVHLSPIWDIHPRIVQYQDANPPPRLTALSPLSTPWWAGTYATCPHSVVLATYDN